MKNLYSLLGVSFLALSSTVIAAPTQFIQLSALNKTLYTVSQTGGAGCNYVSGLPRVSETTPLNPGQTAKCEIKSSGASLVKNLSVEDPAQNPNAPVCKVTYSGSLLAKLEGSCEGFKAEQAGAGTSAVTSIVFGP